MDIEHTSTKSLIVLHDSLCCFLQHDDSNWCFHNGDKGHTVYRGWSDENLKANEYADGPKKNELFKTGNRIYNQLLHVVEDEQAEIELISNSPFKDWESFVRAVMQMHNATPLP